MTKRAKVLASSPAALKGAISLGMLQALGWVVLVLTAQSSSTLSSSHVPKAALLAIGVVFLGGLSVLPIGAALSRYPRRRYREAVLYQTALVLVCVAAFAGHLSVASAVLTLWPLSVITLLVSPGTRQFVLEREGRFITLEA